MLIKSFTHLADHLYKVSKKLLLMVSLLVCQQAQAQITAIPDTNFELALIAFGYDTLPLNGSVPTANIDTITTLVVGGHNIYDLKGITDFVALEDLGCSYNYITTLDLSGNPYLEELDCNDNQITSIDLSNNTLLNKLYCQDNNQLTALDCSNNPLLTTINCNNCSIDSLELGIQQINALRCANNELVYLNIANSTGLGLLHCENNFLPSLDLSIHTFLHSLRVQNNLLTTLNLTGVALIDELFCQNNLLTALDISTCNNLLYVNCDSNQLSNLIVNYGLTDLICRYNQLITLDVSNSIDLGYLDCSNNVLTALYCPKIEFYTLYCDNNMISSLTVDGFQDFSCTNNLLSYLNVKTGYNTTAYGFNTTNNPNLNCIQVDDSTWSANNWLNIDAQHYFSDTCALPSTAIEQQQQEVNKQLLRIIDVLGRESTPKKNTPLFYRYDDGSVEKKLIVE